MSEHMALKAKSTKSNLFLMRILSLAGLAVAVYLAITYGLEQAPYCAGSGGCESVQTSEYVTIADGLNVPILGALGYVLLLALSLLRGRVGDNIEFYLPVLTYGVALIGFSYSAYLTYLEAFVIRAWCYWCLVSAIFMTAILVLSVLDLRRAWFESESEWREKSPGA